jgi:hypothetical protein
MAHTGAARVYVLMFCLPGRRIAAYRSRDVLRGEYEAIGLFVKVRGTTVPWDAFISKVKNSIQFLPLPKKYFIPLNLGVS